MTSPADPSTKTARRARALRAAHVVTLSLSVGALAACDGAATTSDDAATGPDAFTEADAAILPDAALGDTGFGLMDTGPVDAAIEGDAGVTDDAAMVADAGMADDAAVAEDAHTFVGDAGCGDALPPTNRFCCEAVGGFWDEASSFCAIAVPGPFVPPSMSA
jgi:hypothetical protein